MTAKTAILLTRPEHSARDMAAQLQDAPAQVVLSPVLTIRPVDAAVPVDDRVLVLTSANAIRMAAQKIALKDRRAYVVGESSASLARGFGAEVVGVAPDVAGLADCILRDPPDRGLIHLRGSHVAGNLAERLTDAGLGIESIVIYEQVKTPLTDEARALLKSGRRVILPIFSPRTAEILSTYLVDETPRAGIILISISGAVAQAWAGPEPIENYVAASPTADAMLAEIRDRAAD